VKIGCSETKVGEFDDDSAVTGTIWVCLPTVGDDKVFRLDIAVKYVLCVTSCDCVTHLSEH